MATPNMGLILPVPTIELGPAWAFELNTALTVLDGHNHTPGSGAPITPLAMNINSILSFNGNFASQVAAVFFSLQSSNPSTSLSLFSKGVDLWFKDGNGVPIQLTISGGVAGTPGSISGLSSPASAQFIAGTFQFQQGVATAGNGDFASMVLRYPGSYPAPAGSNWIMLAVPTAIAAGYKLTLPAAPPAVGTSFLTMDSLGNVGASLQPDNNTIQIVGNTLISTAGIPAGVISMFGAFTPPTGWLFCDGSSVLRATYPALFSAIGTAYGSADGTHFNLPDARGKFARGWNAGTGNDPDAAARTAQAPGGATGDNVGSVQGSAFQAHNHNDQVITLFTGTGNINNGTNHTVAPGVTGTSGTSSETRPINFYVNFIIKT